ncbi:hypothetical protein BDP27DRAFT_1400880 [Rhodocollybia butyracea]|uniref:Uncharacterized protein n=1 Tax=Rhodocollybia butyracea TaxID=206335 RepID=A0A9P5UBU2_9AGAR|nr:hypothetical protein BDP27DRAFT_1400880 [Rhodocollybia butyracea]
MSNENPAARLVVHVKYSREKARTVLKQNKTRHKELLLDLSKLKLPHPAESNVVYDDSCISFFWETNKLSHLWSDIERAVETLHSSEQLTAVMKARKIERVWTQESPISEKNLSSNSQSTAANSARRSCAIIVHITYSSSKSHSMLKKSSWVRYASIRRDLSQLKLPHPPEANVVLSETGISCFWESRKNTPLWYDIEKVVHSQYSDETILKIMKETSVEHISMEEVVGSNPLAFALASRSPSRSPLSQPAARLPHRSTRRNRESPGRSSLGRLRSASERPESWSNHPSSSELVDEFWAIEGTLASKFARCVAIEKELRELDVSDSAEERNQGGYDLEVDIILAESLLLHERKQRRETEMVLVDVLRECTTPNVIPGMMEIVTESIVQPVLSSAYYLVARRTRLAALVVSHTVTDVYILKPQASGLRDLRRLNPQKGN